MSTKVTYPKAGLYVKSLHVWKLNAGKPWQPVCLLPQILSKEKHYSDLQYSRLVLPDLNFIIYIYTKIISMQSFVGWLLPLILTELHCYVSLQVAFIMVDSSHCMNSIYSSVFLGCFSDLDHNQQFTFQILDWPGACFTKQGYSQIHRDPTASALDKRFAPL